MSFKIIRVGRNFLTRSGEKLCWLCTKKLNLKLNELVVIKHTRASRYAHPVCAIKHNWVSQNQINKF